MYFFNNLDFFNLIFSVKCFVTSKELDNFFFPLKVDKCFYGCHLLTLLNGE